MPKPWIQGLMAISGLIVAATSNAQTDPLTERGIDPQILELMISDLTAEVGYTRFAEIEIVSDEETIEERALFQFNPVTDYGIDLFVKFETERPRTTTVRRWRNSLENSMRLQHRIRTMDFQLDYDSLAVESQDGSKAVILFRYSPFTLPQQVAWMRHLQGRIFVDGDRVERIQVELDEGQTYLMDGMRVRASETTANFVRLTDGRDVIGDSESRVVASRFGREHVINLRTTAVAFSDPDGADLTPAGIGPPPGVDISDFDNTIRVNLDRRWPILGRQARKAGFEIPKPFGIGMVYTDIETRMRFTSFEINGQQEAIEAIFDPNGSGIDVEATAPQIRADWFPFPFVNLFAMYGESRADGNLLIRTTDLAQLVGLPEIIEATIKLETDILTLGVTGAVGWKNFFGSVTAQVTNAENREANTDTDITSVTVIAGYFFPKYRMRVLAGAEYMDQDDTMTGLIDLGDGDSLDFDIGLEREDWAGRVGVYREFGNNWTGNFTYTYGDDREGWTMFAVYRF